MKRLIFTLFLFIGAGNLFAQTFGESLKVDTVDTETWNSTAWVKSTKIINTYDGSCKLPSTLLQEWDNVSLTWVNLVLFTNTYGSNNKISQDLIQYWDKVTGTWITGARNTYTYDASDRVDFYKTEAYFSGTWLPSSKTIYTYNASSTIATILHQLYAGISYKNSTLSTYSYNGDGSLHQVLDQNWVGNTWVNGARISNTYDAAPKLISTLNESWQSNAWVNFEYTTYTYNGSGRVSVATSQKWSGGLWVNDNRSNYYYTTSCTLLPLKLISFTASKDKSIVQLNWQTAEELNTSHFDIQRSTDGINFSNIGKITAAGNGNHSYHFADNIQNIKGDKIYYRLQMTDKDGKFTLSKIIPLTLELFTGNIKAYPNPVKDQLYILYNTQNATKATIRITDASGKNVHTETVGLANGGVGINVSMLGKGVYYVQLITDKGIQKTQFIKQ